MPGPSGGQFSTAFPMSELDRTILRANDTPGPNQYKVSIETGMVVVDAISGEELELPRTEKMRHQTASEILVMDENGNFRVKNDMNDRTQFRNMLHLADETQTVGKPKKRKKKDDDEGGAGNKFGGGFGGGAFGDGF